MAQEPSAMTAPLSVGCQLGVSWVSVEVIGCRLRVGWGQMGGQNQGQKWIQHPQIGGEGVDLTQIGVKIGPQPTLNRPPTDPNRQPTDPFWEADSSWLMNLRVWGPIALSTRGWGFGLWDGCTPTHHAKTPKSQENWPKIPDWSTSAAE